MSTAAPPADPHNRDTIELRHLAEEQAALRRVATLVAKGAASAEVFASVAEEVARLIPADGAALTRYEPDGTTVTALGGWTSGGGYTYVGTTYPLAGTVSGRVLETRRPARIDSYAEDPSPAPEAARAMGWRSSVGAPIAVEGRLWGVLAVVSKSERPLPDDTERRLVAFTELVATAIANAESREELTRLAEEQAALRRVATLVAEGAEPNHVFAAVADEVAAMFGVPIATMLRFDADGLATLLAAAGGEFGGVDARFRVADSGLLKMVFDTGRSAYIDDWTDVPGPGAELARRAGIHWSVGVPIVVDGALWGVIIAGSRDAVPPGPDFEPRLATFTELLATAIANAESRAELDASRARIVATADATRRRIERDLHDGAQQQLVSLALAVRAAQATVPEEFAQHRDALTRVVDGLTAVLDDLREIALGLHPVGLSEDGLTPALKRVAARSPLRVNLDVRADGRFPEAVEVAAYYVVSEALTNAAKYADVPVVDVTVAADGGGLRVEVRDKGRGGAEPADGSGLLGLRDRVEAIGGTMQLSSPPGAGTSLCVVLPLRDRHARG